MQLSGFKVEGLRSVAGLRVDLSEVCGSPRRRVVLVGPNGCGKTTVLDAIAHAFGSLGAGAATFGARALSATDVRGGVAGVTGTEPPRGEFTVNLALSSSERYAVRRHVHGAPARGSLTFRLGAGAGGADVDDQPRGFRAAVEVAVAAVAHPPCVFLPSCRGLLEAGAGATPEGVGDLERRGGCLSKARGRYAALAAHLAAAYATPELADPGGAFARMWKVFARYLPDVPRPIGVEEGELLFRAPSGVVLPMSSLSDGERALLLMFGEVTLRSPVDGVVMIDEVEQHLHPRWERDVLYALSSLVPSAQFILTTQSVYVAACAPDDVLRLPTDRIGGGP